MLEGEGLGGTGACSHRGVIAAVLHIDLCTCVAQVFFLLLLFLLSW